MQGEQQQWSLSIVEEYLGNLVDKLDRSSTVEVSSTGMHGHSNVLFSQVRLRLLASLDGPLYGAELLRRATHHWQNSTKDHHEVNQVRRCQRN